MNSVMTGGRSTASAHDQALITERVLDAIEEVLSPKRKDKSIDKMVMVIGILEKVVQPKRLEDLRKAASEPKNILKVALHLSEEEMKTTKGQNLLATRLKELIRMDGQYVTKEETVDSVVQLMEIHHMFGKPIND